MFGYLTVVDRQRIPAVEPVWLDANFFRHALSLLSQDAQDIAIFAHDRFSQCHLCLEPGV